MNADEFFDGLASLAGSQDAGASNGIVASRLVNGVEYAHVAAVDEKKMRSAWKRRRGGGATPLLVVTDDPGDDGRLRVLGPQADGPVRRLRGEILLDLVSQTTALKKLEAIRRVAQEVERLDTEGVAGLSARGLGTQHLYATRLKESRLWDGLAKLVVGISTKGWREVLEGLGYEVKELPRRGYMASAAGRPVIVVHPRRSAEAFARLDESGRLPEGALVADCMEHGAPYGMLAAGSRMRLLRAGRDAAGATTRYLELDAAALESDGLSLLGLLAPSYLADGGFEDVLRDARDYGAQLRLRLDRALRQDVLPVLGRELGRWAVTAGKDVRDDEVRADLEAAALTFVFRALFLLYAESAGHLPMSNHAYAHRSFTRVAERAAEELEQADKKATTLWRDIAGLVDAMRTGQTAWGVPAYNGALFASDGFAGAETLEQAQIPDAALAPALVALARDPDDPNVGVDFSGLEIGHLGHIYEGLLSLRLSVADRDFRYDAGDDRYVTASGDEIEIAGGELLWLTNEGGRKGGGVYYTRTELVRHLVLGAVRPAFQRHIEEVRKLAERDPQEATAQLFDFCVLDPACGSAHFLVEVVEELADQIAELLGEVALPGVGEELETLRAAAGRTFGAGIEDTALLKRLVLKRCVYGVDLSPMGAEIAKVSLWLSSFVPGLSLAYLDHNVQVGNSLIGVARPETVTPPGAEYGQIVMFGEALDTAIAEAAKEAVKLREIDDRNPDEVEASRGADADLHAAVAGAERVLNLWTAQPLGLPGAREEALQQGKDILAGQGSLLADQAEELCDEHGVLHWPLAFAEVFAREGAGFDVIVGNPPWDEVTIERPSFFSRFRPGIRRGTTEQQREAAIAELIEERPELAEQFEAEQERAERARQYFSASGDYLSMSGDPDLYKFFCQRYGALLRAGGSLGVVLPRNTFVNQGSAGFRGWLFKSMTTRRVDFLKNRRRWAFDMESRQKVALVVAERDAPTTEHRVSFAGTADSLSAWLEQVNSEGIAFNPDAFGPDWAPPLIRNQAEADLLARIRKNGNKFPLGTGRWRCFPAAELHETKDAHFWENATTGSELWKGESFAQYDPHGGASRLCPVTEELTEFFDRARPGTGSMLNTLPMRVRRAAVVTERQRARVAFSDITQSDNSRTVVACLVPAGVLLGNTAPYLAFPDGDEWAQACCLALMNSLPFDWQARRFVEIHVSFFILEALQLPSLDDPAFFAVAKAAGRLSCVDHRFEEFAAALGVECGPLDEAEETRLRVDIDARVAHAWGVSAEELDVIFSDFTLGAVPEQHRDAVRRRFTELS